jgi:hypothetical protein
MMALLVALGGALAAQAACAAPISPIAALAMLEDARSQTFTTAIETWALLLEQSDAPVVRDAVFLQLAERVMAAPQRVLLDAAVQQGWSGESLGAVLDMDGGVHVVALSVQSPWRSAKLPVESVQTVRLRGDGALLVTVDQFGATAAWLPQLSRESAWLRWESDVAVGWSESAPTLVHCAGAAESCRFVNWPSTSAWLNGNVEQGAVTPDDSAAPGFVSVSDDGRYAVMCRASAATCAVVERNGSAARVLARVPMDHVDAAMLARAEDLPVAWSPDGLAVQAGEQVIDLRTGAMLVERAAVLTRSGLEGSNYRWHGWCGPRPMLRTNYGFALRLVDLAGLSLSPALGEGRSAERVACDPAGRLLLVETGYDYHLGGHQPALVWATFTLPFGVSDAKGEASAAFNPLDPARASYGGRRVLANDRPVEVLAGPAEVDARCAALMLQGDVTQRLVACDGQALHAEAYAQPAVDARVLGLRLSPILASGCVLTWLESGHSEAIGEYFLCEWLHGALLGDAFAARYAPDSRLRFVAESGAREVQLVAPANTPTFEVPHWLGNWRTVSGTTADLESRASLSCATSSLRIEHDQETLTALQTGGELAWRRHLAPLAGAEEAHLGVACDVIAVTCMPSFSGLSTRLLSATSGYPLLALSVIDLQSGDLTSPNLKVEFDGATPWVTVDQIDLAISVSLPLVGSQSCDGCGAALRRWLDSGRSEPATGLPEPWRRLLALLDADYRERWELQSGGDSERKRDDEGWESHWLDSDAPLGPATREWLKAWLPERATG